MHKGQQRRGVTFETVTYGAVGDKEEGRLARAAPEPALLTEHSALKLPKAMATCKFSLSQRGKKNFCAFFQKKIQIFLIIMVSKFATVPLVLSFTSVT